MVADRLQLTAYGVVVNALFKISDALEPELWSPGNGRTVTCSQYGFNPATAASRAVAFGIKARWLKVSR